MKKNKLLLAFSFLVFLLLIAGYGSAHSEVTYSESWDGRGSDSLSCGKIGEGPRTEEGWIHWVFSNKGESVNAELYLGGTGSGVYQPSSPLEADVWHFFTPYFEINGLTATINLYGGNPETGGGLVISDYCPGTVQEYEELTVSKTVIPSYTRTHDWLIEKSVQPEAVYLYTDGSGDKLVTWTIDLIHEGFTHSDWNVSGTITIENTGTIDATILAINDVLGGVPITANCNENLPYLLKVGEILICTYYEEGWFEGYNQVTVLTEKSEYSTNTEIDWQGPNVLINFVNLEVNVIDESDLLGLINFGSFNAFNYEVGQGETFYITDIFLWSDYGSNNCGKHTYHNIAKVIGDNNQILDYDEAMLDVYVQCFVYKYETAYAKDDPSTCFIPTFRNWGWTNPIMPGRYEWPLWAGAARCDTSKGALVGSVTVVYDENGYVTVEYNVSSPYILKETHVYAGYNMFPQVKRGKKTISTIAPGQYYNAGPFDGSEVYVIAHAVVGNRKLINL